MNKNLTYHTSTTNTFAWQVTPGGMPICTTGVVAIDRDYTSSGVNEKFLNVLER